MKHFFKNIVVLLNLIAVLALLIVYMSVYISPADAWAPALIGLAYPYILFVNCLFILYWLFVSPRWSLLSIVVILLGFSNLQNYFKFIPEKTEKKGIVVCSYNVKQFEEGGYERRTENVQNIVFLMGSKKPDIVCFQEMRFPDKKGMTGFKEKFDLSGLPKYSDANRTYGPITFSNFPIVHKSEFHFKGTGNMIIATDVVTPTDTVRIFNCHLESYRFTPKDISSLDSITINNQKKNIKEFRHFGSKLKNAFIKRAEQAEELRSQIEQSPYPVIVCGDFNDTPVSYCYRTVRGDLKDAFVESGSGIGNTYLGRLPSFRIDYIMHSPRFSAFNFRIDHVDFSDHYPVSCILIPKD